MRSNRTGLMDSKKIRALIEWVNCMQVGRKITKLTQLRNGHHLLGIVFLLRNNPERIDLDRQQWTETVQSFLNSFFDIELMDHINFGDASNGNETELAKIVIVILCAVVQHERNHDFVQKLQTLDNDSQEQVKKILEATILNCDARIRLDFADVIYKTDCSNRSVGASRTPNAGNRQMSQSSSSACGSQSPINQLMQSPQMIQKTASWMLESKIKQLEHDLSKERGLRAVLATEASHAEEEIDARDREIEALKTQLSTLKKEVSDIKKSKMQADINMRSDGDEAALRIRLKQDKLNDTEMALKAMQESHDELEKVNADLKIENVELAKMSDMYKCQLHEDKLLTDQLSNAADALSERDHKIESLHCALMEAKQTIDELEQLYQEKIRCSHLEPANTSCDSIGESMAVVTNVYNMELQEANDTLQGRLVALTSELKDVKSRNEYLLSEIQLANEHLDSARRSQTEEKNRLTALLDQEMSVVKDLEKSGLQLEMDLSDAIAEQTRLIGCVEDKNQEIFTLQTVYQDAKMMESQLNAQLSENVSEIQNLKTMLSDERSTMQDFEEKHRRFEKEFHNAADTHTKERDGLFASIEQRDQQIFDLRKTLEELKSYQLDTEIQLKDSRNTIASNEEQIHHQCAQLSLKSSMAEDLAEKLAVREKELISAMESLSEERQRLTVTSSEKDRLTADLEAARERENSLELQLNKETSERISEATLNQRLTGQLNAATSAAIDSEEKYIQLKAALSEAEKVFTDERIRFLDIANAKDKELDDLRAACNEAKECRLKLDNCINEKIGEIEDLTVSLAFQKSSVGDLELKLLQLENDLAAVRTSELQIRSQLDEEVAKVSDLSAKLAEEKMRVEAVELGSVQLEKDLTNAQTSLQLLQGQFDDKISELSILCDKLSLETLHVKDAECTIAKLETELANSRTLEQQLKSNLDDHILHALSLTDQVSKETMRAQNAESKIAQLEDQVIKAGTLEQQLRSQLDNRISEISSVSAHLSEETTRLNESKFQIMQLEKDLTNAHTLEQQLRRQLKDNISEISILSDKLSRETSCVKDAESRLIQLENELTEARSLEQQFKSQLDDHVSETLSLRAQLSQETLRVEEGKAEIMQMMNELANAGSLEKQLKCQLDDRTSEISSVSAHLSEETSRLKDAESIIMQLENDLTNSHTLEQQLRRHLEDNVSEISTLSDKFSEETSRMKSAESKIIQLENELVVARSSEQQLKSQMDDHISDTSSLSTKLTQETLLVTEAKAEIVRLENELANAGSLEKQLKCQLDDRTSEISSVSAHLSEETSRLKDAESKIMQLENDLTNAHTLEQQLRRQLEENIFEISTLSDKSSQETSRMKGAESKIIQLENELAVATTWEQQLKSQIDDHISDTSSLSTKLSQETLLVTEAKAEIVRLGSELANAGSLEKLLKCQLDDRISEISVLYDKLSQETSRLEEAESKIIQLGNELAHAGTLEERFQNHLHDKDNEISNLSAQLSQEKSRAKKGEDEIAQLTNDLADATTSKQQLTSQLEDQVAKVSDLVAQISNERSLSKEIENRGAKLESDLAEAIKCHEEDREKWSKMISDRDQEIDKLVLFERGLREDVDGEQSMVATLREQLETLSTLLSEEQLSTKSVKEEHLVLKIDLDDVRSKNIELEEIILEKDSKLKLAADDFQAERDDMLVELTRLRAENCNLKAAIKEQPTSQEQSRKFATLTNRVEKLELDNRTLAQKSNSFESLNRRLKSQLQALQDEMKVEVEALQQQVEASEAKHLAACTALQEKCLAEKAKYEKAKEYLAFAKRQSEECDGEVRRLEQVCRTQQSKLDDVAQSMKMEQAAVADLDLQLQQERKRSSVLAEKFQQYESCQKQVVQENRNLQVQLKFATDQLRNLKRDDPWSTTNNHQGPNVSMISNDTIAFNSTGVANSTALSAIENIPAATGSGRAVPPGAGSFFACAEEEGELFEASFLNDMKRGRCDVDLNADRISELQRRNTLCLPHLKTSYPVEMQVQSKLEYKDEDFKASRAIDSASVSSMSGHSSGRAPSEASTYSFSLGGAKAKTFQPTYHKPGPPTPGKTARAGGESISDKLAKTPASLKKLFRRGNGGASGSESGTTTPKRNTPQQRRNAENRPPPSESAQRPRKNLAFSVGFSPKVKSKPKQSLTAIKPQASKQQLPKTPPPQQQPKLPTRR